MRRWLVLATFVGLLSCDNIIGPNTDVGLSVWAEVSPSYLSVRDTLTPLTIRVCVANQSDHKIDVVGGGPPYGFTGDPTKTQGIWGSYRIASSTDPLFAGPYVDWWGEPVYSFDAHYAECNEEILTLARWKNGGWPLATGTFHVRSWFNAREGKSARFTLIP